MKQPFIPYFQTTRYRVEAMIDLAHIQPGMTAADLGSGDGRIAIALAQAGAIVTGYELDRKLVEISRGNINNVILANAVCPESDSGVVSLPRMTPPIILQKDFWEEDLGHYDIITVYPMPDIMEALERKLQKELQTGSKVLLNYYPFPTWEKAAEKDHIFLYKK